MIADCHIYDRHIPLVRKMLENPSYPAPKFRMDPSITDFYHFTPELSSGGLPVGPLR